MPRRIFTFPDGGALEFDQGRFDEHCVYEVQPDGGRSAPSDVGYFAGLLRIARARGENRVYEDFVRVFEVSETEVTETSVEVIRLLSEHYGSDEPSALRIFLILHMGMIAENVKKNTRLGKRIKRLGVHALLLEGYSVDRAANFMRGKGWREIDAMCRERGF